MIKYTEPIMRKRFSGENAKEAKMKALKWVGKYAMCRAELKDVSFAFDCDNAVQYPTVTVTVFAHLDEGEAKERHCKICKEAHACFFVNERCNCNECEAEAFEKRMADMLRSKKAYYKESLKKILQGVL